LVDAFPLNGNSVPRERRPVPFREQFGQDRSLRLASEPDQVCTAGQQQNQNGGNEDTYCTPEVGTAGAAEVRTDLCTYHRPLYSLILIALSLFLCSARRLGCILEPALFAHAEIGYSTTAGMAIPRSPFFNKFFPAIPIGIGRPGKTMHVRTVLLHFRRARAVADGRRAARLTVRIRQISAHAPHARGVCGCTNPAVRESEPAP
jgi:hypothetical protein